MKEEYIKTVVEGIVTVPDEMIELIDAHGFEYVYKSCIIFFYLLLIFYTICNNICLKS